MSTEDRTEIPALRGFLLLTLFFGLSASVAALLDGPWLDEFWSLYESDPALSLRSLLERRWLYDAHPLPASALYSLVRLVGIDDLAAARLLLNLPPLMFFAVATFLFTRRSEDSRSFYPILGILVIGFWDTVDYFADFRSYFWQVIAVAVALQYLHFTFADAPPRDSRRRWLLHGIGLTAVLLSICLHFMTGLVMSILFTLALLALIRARRGGAFRALAAVLLLGWTFMLVTASLQVPRVKTWMDISWITTTSAGALLLYGKAFAKVVLSNPVVVFWAVKRAAAPADAARSGRSFLFPIILGASIVLGSLVLFAANAISPIIHDRYLIAFQLMALALVAALSSDLLARKRFALTLLLLWAVAMIGLQSFRTARQPGWRDGWDRVTDIVRACPQTRVLAASGWRFTPDRASGIARIEGEVSALGYRWLADRAGVPIQIMDPVAPITIRPNGPCPTLVWFEHLYAWFPTPQAVLAAGDIKVAGPADLSFTKTEWGGLLVIGPATRASPASQ